MFGLRAFINHTKLQHFLSTFYSIKHFANCWDIKEIKKEKRNKRKETWYNAVSSYLFFVLENAEHLALYNLCSSSFYQTHKT